MRVVDHDVDVYVRWHETQISGLVQLAPAPGAEIDARTVADAERQDEVEVRRGRFIVMPGRRRQHDQVRGWASACPMLFDVLRQRTSPIIFIDVRETVHPPRPSLSTQLSVLEGAELREVIKVKFEPWRTGSD